MVVLKWLLAKHFGRIPLVPISAAIFNPTITITLHDSFVCIATDFRSIRSSLYLSLSVRFNPESFCVSNDPVHLIWGNVLWYNKPLPACVPPIVSFLHSCQLKIRCFSILLLLSSFYHPLLAMFCIVSKWRLVILCSFSFQCLNWKRPDSPEAREDSRASVCTHKFQGCWKWLRRWVWWSCLPVVLNDLFTHRLSWLCSIMHNSLITFFFSLRREL